MTPPSTDFVNPVAPRFYPRHVTRKTLVSERDERGTRHVEVSLEDHSLVIRGQDTGKSVEDFWGSDEYEWAWTIDRNHEPALRKLLMILPDEQLIEAIVERFSGDDYFALSQLLSDAPFPTNFWSHS